MKHELPELKYSYDALEPHIDALTMETHHSKHHAGYVKKLNAALEGQGDLAEKSIEELLKSIDSLPEEIRTAVGNNAGGHANHSLFWQIMLPPSTSSGQAGGGGEPSGDLATAIDKAFGSISRFKDEFSKAALSQFGSGWAWLVAGSSNELSVMSTANQDSPLSQGKRPIMGLDVWEHAYYLKYKNKRADYIDAFWNVVNWSEVEKEFRNKV